MRGLSRKIKVFYTRMLEYICRTRHARCGCEGKIGECVQYLLRENIIYVASLVLGMATFPVLSL